MPKGMKGYEAQPTGGYTKYPAESAKVIKHGGNDKKHTPDAQSDGYAGTKYPKASKR